MIESWPDCTVPAMTTAKRIVHLRGTVLGLTQTAFANELGVSRGAVGNWELGKGIKQANLHRIAIKTGASLEWLSTGRGIAPQSKGDLYTGNIVRVEKITSDVPGPETVDVIGYLGTGAEVHRYSTSNEFIEDILAPEGATLHTAAIEIRGDCLGSFLHNWYVFFDDIKIYPTAEMIGALCVVEVDSGQVFVKVLRRHPGSIDRFDLMSEKGDAMTNVAVVWASLVTSMRPK